MYLVTMGLATAEVAPPPPPLDGDEAVPLAVVTAVIPLVGGGKAKGHCLRTKIRRWSPRSLSDSRMMLALGYTFLLGGGGGV